MTENEEQPLLIEPESKTKKPSKSRAAKPKTAAKASIAKSRPKAPKAKPADDEPEAVPAPAKTAKPRATKKAAPKAKSSKTKSDKPAEIQTPLKADPVSLPVAPTPAAAPASGEEWRPSGPKEMPIPAAPSESAQAPASEPATAPATGARQYPVYIPRHVAKQLEQSGQAVPVAVTAEVAASMPMIAAAVAAAAADASHPPARHQGRQQREDRGRDDRGRDDRGRDDRRRDDRSREDRSAPEPVEASAIDIGSAEDMGVAEGIVEISGKGFGFIRDPKKGFTQNASDVFVTPEIARTFNLRDGQWVKGQTRRGNRGAQLYRLMEVNGEDPEKSRDQPAFEELTVVSPLERFNLETVPDRHTTRIIDLMAPIGKGQRGLIVAPPRTGKTTLLQHIGDAIVKNHPETKLIILLVDERPEEVTDIKRTVPTAEIMASSNDMDVKSHTRIAQLAIERAKRLVEAGQDVFILLDSITRVGRAFNNALAGGGRTGSGGLDNRALEIPRRLFAAARNTEEAGSLTIVATALIETGSMMDDRIFQEFKGTGNMELMLDRKISDQRIYPAIDIFLSGTRREELLIPADDLHKIGVIRRGLSGYKPMEAIERLLFFMKKFPTNAEMLKNIPG